MADSKIVVGDGLERAGLQMELPEVSFTRFLEDEALVETFTL